MIRKIVIFALIAVGAVFFYKKFLAGTVEPFFNRHTGKVDFMQLKVPDYKVEK